MLAKFFNADACDIYTDVDGVYTTDPRNHLKAKKIDKISYDEMLEMASLRGKSYAANISTRCKIK